LIVDYSFDLNLQSLHCCHPEPSEGPMHAWLVSKRHHG
jgi:hypothetical protein